MMSPLRLKGNEGWRPQRDSNPRFSLESEKEGDPTDQ